MEDQIELTRAEKDGKYGFTDGIGGTFVPFVCECAGGFSGGLAGVEKDGEEFYINKQGRRLR